jgi:hypothetical protein
MWRFAAAFAIPAGLAGGRAIDIISLSCRVRAAGKN